MKKIGVRNEIERLLVANFPRDFWISMLDNLSAMYGRAHDSMADGLALHPHDLVRALPQVRHYALNSSMRKVGKALDIEVMDLKADNSGENYVVLRSGALQMGRIGVNQGAQIPREAKHRALIAALNSRLEGFTPDLFLPKVHRIPSSTLGILVVNVNPKATLSQTEMVDLQVGVPFSDLSGWHYLESCSVLLEKYVDGSVGADNVGQLDKAVVRLKHAIDEIEAAEAREET